MYTQNGLYYSFVYILFFFLQLRALWRIRTFTLLIFFILLCKAFYDLNHYYIIKMLRNTVLFNIVVTQGVILEWFCLVLGTFSSSHSPHYKSLQIANKNVCSYLTNIFELDLHHLIDRWWTNVYHFVKLFNQVL